MPSMLHMSRVFVCVTFFGRRTRCLLQLHMSRVYVCVVFFRRKARRLLLLYRSRVYVCVVFFRRKARRQMPSTASTSWRTQASVLCLAAALAR